MPFASSGLFYYNSLDRSISIAGCLVSFYFYHVTKKNPVFIANIVSDLGLHCLPMTLLKIYRLNGLYSAITLYLALLYCDLYIFCE